MGIYDRLNKVKKLAEEDDKQKKNTELAQAASTGTGTRSASSSTALSEANTALIRSRKSRDSFDAAVRANYAAAQKTGAPVLTSDFDFAPVTTMGTNAGSILDATKTVRRDVGGGRGGSDVKPVQVPTLSARIANTAVGAAKSVASQYTNTAGMAVKGAQELNTLASGTAQKAQTAKDNITRYQQEIQTQRRNGTLTNVSLARLNQLISANNRAIKAAEGTLDAQNAATEAGIQTLNRTADKLQASSQQNVSNAKQGLGTIGSALVDIGVTGTQMAADAGTAALTGTSALVPMFIRSFGGGAQQARQAGASAGTQVLYGIGSGVIETATEKISNVAAPFRKMFGAGILDTAVKKTIGKLTKNTVGKALLTAGASAAGEGFEEFIGDLLYPVLQRATYDKNAKFNLSDALYDAVIGGALGMIGSAPSVINSVSNDIMPRLKTAKELTQNTENENAASGMETVKKNATDTESIGQLSDQDVMQSREISDTQSAVALLRNNIQTLQKMQPVANVEGTEVAKTGKATDNAMEFLKSIGNKALRPDFGEVLFSRSKVKNSLMGHGFGPVKTDMIAAVPAVIQSGTQINFTPNWKGRGYDSYVFAAPVTYKGNTVMVDAVVIRDNANRYYLHEAVDSDGNLIYGKMKSPDTVSDRSAKEPQNTVTDTELSLKTVAQPEVKSKGNLTTETDITPKLETLEQKNLREDKSLPGGDAVTAEDDGLNQKRKNIGYMDALADDRNVPKARQENRPSMARKDLRTDVLNLFSVPAGSRRALGEAIDLAGAEMMRTGGITEENRAELMDALYDAGVTVRDADPAYKAVRDDLKGRKIYVDETTRTDLGDDWRGLAGRALGNGFSLTTDPQKGTSVDRIMQEMAGKFGEGMFDESMDSSTSLRELIDIAEAGRPKHISLQEEAEDMVRQYGQGVVEDHADNLRRQMDSALQRFAEKAGLEIKLKDRSDAAIAKEREHWKELLQRSNDRGRERLENQKTQYQDMMQRKKERHERSVAATQTQRSLRYLRRRLGYHDTKLSEALDSLSAEDRETAEHALQNIADNAKSLTAEANEKLKANAERYRALVENDKNYIPGKETLEMLERMDREYLADKSVEELATIHRVVQTLRTHLADMDREIGREHGRKIETIYQKSKAEIQASRGRKAASKARRKTTDFIDSQLTPMNRLKQLGGWKDGVFYSMAEQLEAGERARKEFEVKANRLLKDFREKNVDWIAKSDGQGKNATWYELEVPELLEWGKGDKPIFGDTVKVSLTPAMRVELARGVRNYDNLRHAEGGVTFPDQTLYSKGERAEAYARGTTIKLAPETMKKLFSYENLTPQEQELYRMGDQFFNKMAKEAINKTSQELDGVDRAMSQNYSKIYTNASYRPTDVTTVDQSLGGMGSLQKRVQSKAPMLAVSMWEAYADTIDTVGKYSGLAIPVRNMNMLYNWMESGQNESLKSVLEKKWGTSSTKFMGNLLNELQNKQALDKSGVDALADYLLRNYVTATFGANPGIVLKQATSFPSGAAVLGWDTVPTPGQMRKVDAELIARYTPELEYRSMGYATPELAELKNNPNWTQRNKFTRFVFGGAIQAMDRATVKCMWPWAENAVRKHYSDLEPGSDAFYRKTAELFNKAVSETQPMYDVMHRSEIMQNPSALTRTFTMFKTVPLQQQNMIRRAIGEAQAANTPAEISKARGKVASTAASLVVATLGYEGVEFFNQLLKNAAKGYRDDDDDKLTAKSVLTTLAENSVKDLAGITVGGKDLADILMKAFGNVDFYETEPPGLSQMMDLKTAAEQTMETFKTMLSDTKDLKENGGSLKQYVKDNGNDLLGDVKDLATLLAELSKGVPVPNIEKYLLGTLQWTSPELREEYKTLWDSTNKRDLAGLSGGALRVRVEKLMDLRVDNLSNEARDELARLYETVGAEVIPPDVTGTIRMGDEDETTSLTRTMRQTYQNAYGKALQDNLEKLLTSKSYQSMTDLEKSAAVTDLYDYAKAVAEEKTVGKEMTAGAKKAAGVIADGGELPDYLHFCATMGERNAAERLEYLSRGKYSEASKAAIYLNALASDSKQKAWAELKQKGITKEEFYQYALVVNGQTAKADLLRAIDGLSLSDDKKATMYFAAEASDSEKEKLAAAEKEGVSEKAYFQYLTASARMSKKEQKLETINALSLTSKQKTALYYANGWAQSTLDEAPWISGKGAAAYDTTPKLTKTGESTPGKTYDIMPKLVKTSSVATASKSYDIMPKLQKLN